VVRKRSPFLKFINDVIGHIIEGGIFMHIKKGGFAKAKIETEFSSPTFDDTHSIFRCQVAANSVLFLDAWICIGICLFF
jgi:hypothetical protein